MLDRIHITNLEVPGILGINPDERVNPQPIRVSVTMWVDTSKAAGSDDIADAANYRTVAKAIIAHIEQGSPQLVERLVQEIADRVPGHRAAGRGGRSDRGEADGAASRRVGRHHHQAVALMAGTPVDVVISAGSNIDREHNLPEAINRLRRHHRIDVRRVSRLYDTVAVGGPPGTAPYFNAAILVTTDLGIDELRSELRGIEESLGRVRTDDPDASRTMDLDVSYYGDMVDPPAIPDPAVVEQPHVAIPIAEIVPSWVHPGTGESAVDIAARLDPGGVHPVPGLELVGRLASRGIDFDDVTDVFAPRMSAFVRQQLVELGEDPDREGLRRTPLRVAKAMDFLTSGYSATLDEVVNDAIFDAEGAEEMVVVKDIEFYSMCEHHMLPFFGKAAVAYLPKGQIIGLSKVARILDLFARRLQVQERLTNQVADAMLHVLDPHGVAVVDRGPHFCMMMRGVQKQDSSMVTSAMRGTFATDARTRNEFLDLTKR